MLQDRRLVPRHSRILQDPCLASRHSTVLHELRPASLHSRILQGPVFFRATPPPLHNMPIVARARAHHSLSAVAPRSALGPIQPPLYIFLSLSLSLSSLSPAFPPARVSFESVHCHMRRIYIVNTHPVECAGFSCNCWLEMACWLFPGLSHAYCISWRHASVSGGRRQGAPTLFKKHAAGRKGSCFAHCTVGGETLFLHKCK